MVRFLRSFALLWLCSIQLIAAIEVEWNNTDSIKSAAKIVAKDMLLYFTGLLPDGTIGVRLLPSPYYWWQAGAMFGGLIDYYHYTGDDEFNALITKVLQSQVGPHNDFMPPEQKSSLGNDDQAFWAMAAMSAAETRFPNPTDGKAPSWLALVQAVFNEQIGRWDTTLCNGGLRWQIYQISGYDLKNTISNGCLFNIAARLARYTGDDMYAQWAVKVWDWMERIGLIDENFSVFDNSEARVNNCSRLDRNQWTYNAGTILMGASTMFNYTNGSPIWRNRTASLLDTIAYDFFPNGTMREICEEWVVCNPDQRSFKAYLSRWMAASTLMAPFTYNISYPLLLSSARAAASQCTGGANGTLCGIKWWLNGTWDGSDGPGQQMCALETIQSVLIRRVEDGGGGGGHSIDGPVTGATGGTSVGNPGAGFNESAVPPGARIVPATKGDRIGAWFLTGVTVLGVVVLWVFMSTTLLEGVGRSKPTVAGMAKPSQIWKGKEKEGIAAEEGGVEVLDLASRRSTMMSVPGESRRSTMVGDSRRSTMTGAAPEGVVGKKASTGVLLDAIGENEKSAAMAAEEAEKSGEVERSKTPIWKGGEQKT